MNNKELQRIQKMVKMAQKPLKLTSCRIKSQIGDAEDSVCAEIVYEGPKEPATIFFNRKKINSDLEDTIVHELLHLFINKHLGVAENVFTRSRKHKSLKKYQEGEEEAITVLAPLLKKAIFTKKK